MTANIHPIVLTVKEGEKFTYNESIYVFDKCSKMDETVKFWRCEQRGRCNRRIHTKNNMVIKEVNIHSHEADTSVVDVAKVKTLIRRAEDTREPPCVVIN